MRSRGMAVSVWLRDLLISLAISGFIIIFVYQPVKVEGTSMMPSLEDQERIFVNKFVYRLEPIERGDIVVFRYPRDPSKSFIKRVIGLAGDRIRIDAGQVWVNGKLLNEDYVPRAYEDLRSYSEMVVPPEATSCWAITAACRTTAAILARWARVTSTARRCSGIGRWIRWGECDRTMLEFSHSGKHSGVGVKVLHLALRFPPRIPS